MLHSFGTGYGDQDSANRLGHGARPDAASADSDSPDRTLYDRTNSLEIREPASLGDVVGVADVVARERPFATDFTDSCHCFLLLGSQ